MSIAGALDCKWQVQIADCSLRRRAVSALCAENIASHRMENRETRLPFLSDSSESGSWPRSSSGEGAACFHEARRCGTRWGRSGRGPVTGTTRDKRQGRPGRRPPGQEPGSQSQPHGTRSGDRLVQALALRTPRQTRTRLPSSQSHRC